MRMALLCRKTKSKSDSKEKVGLSKMRVHRLIAFAEKKGFVKLLLKAALMKLQNMKIF